MPIRRIRTQVTVRPCLLLAVLVLASFLPHPAGAEDGRSAIKVLVAYHSLSGNTKQMAEAVAEGVKSVAGAEVLLKQDFLR
jgi:NAD(P)H dehydrogenase (quinone)